ncbi:MAG: hypothetical protein HY900_19685 [Deltaproteobacteria bacterium]|nr:hypothetical protein [Deltaproteobacteria bacterium]
MSAHSLRTKLRATAMTVAQKTAVILPDVQPLPRTNGGGARGSQGDPR